LKHLQPPKDKPDCPPGLSSSYFCQQLEEGDLVDVQAPRGRFCLDLNNQQRPIVMIAGGIGVTPLLSMLDTISASNSTIETWFFYCVRNSSEHIMKEHFEDIVKAHANIHFHIIYSHPLKQDTIHKSFHYAQFFSIDLLKELLPSNGYEFFICGPSAMMKSVIKDLKAWDVPKEFIHFEAFRSESVNSAGKVKKLDDSVSAGIKIKFKRSNKTLSWDPSKSNLLELAENNGIYLNYGCRAGRCGTCSVPLISGTVEYPIEPTNQLYEGACLPCIAIPKESLELDA